MTFSSGTLLFAAASLRTEAEAVPAVFCFLATGFSDLEAALRLTMRLATFGAGGKSSSVFELPELVVVAGDGLVFLEDEIGLAADALGAAAERTCQYSIV